MSVQIVRWKSGSGGDTLMKMLLDADPTLCSQNRYHGITDGATKPDPTFVKNFHLPQVATMSLWNFDTVDVKALMTELALLESSDQRWLLKSHCYFDYPYPVLDLVPCPRSLPFVVKATMKKNFSYPDRVLPYHPIRSKIKDSDVLYQFDCFHVAMDRVHTPYDGTYQLLVQIMLGPYQDLRVELQRLGFSLGQDSASYHHDWIRENKSLLPSQLYMNMIAAGRYDHQEPGLTLEERACMLALNGGRFRDLVRQPIKIT